MCYASYSAYANGRVIIDRNNLPFIKYAVINDHFSQHNKNFNFF
jgi:hypothetical protein